MDGARQMLDHEVTSSKKLPSSDHSVPVDILLIGRDQCWPLYMDEVLRRAGFGVRSIDPSEAPAIIADGVQAYPLVVFSNTLNPRDILEIAAPLRLRSPGAKLLLMLGPDSVPINLSVFDATLEGLEGPAALIRMARGLMESSAENGPASVSA